MSLLFASRDAFVSFTKTLVEVAALQHGIGPGMDFRIVVPALRQNSGAGQRWQCSCGSRSLAIHTHLVFSDKAGDLQIGLVIRQLERQENIFLFSFLFRTHRQQPTHQHRRGPQSVHNGLVEDHP